MIPKEHVQDPTKRMLMDISRIVHSALRMLKMGETAAVPLGIYTEETLRAYIAAYALHKKKWFKVKMNPTAKALMAERAPPPPWERAPEEVEQEEI